MIAPQVEGGDDFAAYRQRFKPPDDFAAYRQQYGGEPSPDLRAALQAPLTIRGHTGVTPAVLAGSPRTPFGTTPALSGGDPRYPETVDLPTGADLAHKGRVVTKSAVQGVSEFAPAAIAGGNLVRRVLTATPEELRDREGFRKSVEQDYQGFRQTKPYGVLPSATDVAGFLERHVGPDQPETVPEQVLAFAAQGLPFAGEALVRRGLAQRIRQGVVKPPAPPEATAAQRSVTPDWKGPAADELPPEPFSPSEQVASLPPEMQTSRGTLDYTGPERRGPERSGSPTELVARQGADPQSHGTFVAPMDARAYGVLEAHRIRGGGTREPNPYRSGTPESSDYEAGFASAYDPIKMGEGLPKGVRLTPGGQLAVSPEIATEAQRVTEQTRQRRGVASLLDPPERPAMTQDMVNALGIRVAEKSMRAAGRTEFIAEDFAKAGEAMDRVQPPEPGAPHDQAAVQEGLFGERTLIGNAQTQLLPETAGVPTAKLGTGKFTPDDMGRVRREGTEPPGERPADLLPEPPSVTAVETKRGLRYQGGNPKFAKMDTEALLARHHEIADRLQAMSAEVEKGVKVWTRFDDDVQAQRTGKVVTNAAGRAMGRFKDDGRIMDELTAELHGRGATDEEIFAHADEAQGVADERTGMENEAIRQPGGMQAGHQLPFSLGNELGALGRRKKPTTADLQRLADEHGLDVRAAGLGGKTELPSLPGLTVEMLSDDGLRDMLQRSNRIILDSHLHPEKYVSDEAVVAKIHEDHAVLTMEARARSARATMGLEEGKGALKYLTGLTGAGAGAVTGAATDKEHPLRGALIGGVAGALVGGAGGAAAERVGSSAAVADIQRLLAPAGRTEQSAATAGIVRAQTGQTARANEVARESLRQYQAQLGRLPVPEQMAFIDAIESGRKQANPAHQPAADALRGALDQARRDVQTLGTGKLDHFIVNYFPHIWKDPTKAEEVIGRILGKRPLEGPKSFLKQRTIPTTAEGLAYGLEPVSTNPVDLTLLKLREMNRYVMGQKIMAGLRSRGLTSPDRQAGYARINDYVAQGEWAPEPVATIVNRYLSPGLRGRPLYDAYQGLGNVLNQAQLGFSAFHLGFTSLDAFQSKLALGALQLGRGKPLQAAKSLLGAPVAPLTTYLKGSALLREYLAPGTQGAELARMADLVAEAGGRARMDSFYKNNHVDKLFQALKEHRYPAAALRVIPAAIETAARPIMEHIVPRQKLGVYLDLAREELGHLPAGASTDQVRAVFGRAWDSVDNRMGQLVYDNLFWDKAFKDLSMASVRSVGWNLGTIRELGGGTTDLLRGRWTPRASYVATLPIGVGLAGALTHYLYTGKAPETLKDYFYPRTGHKDAEGNDERVQLPSYMKDVFAYAKHPVQTVGHKLHPLLGIVAQMLQNQDFYGDMIRNPDDPLVTQLQQSAEYLAKEVMPFGVTNILESRRREQPLAVQLPSLIGVTPAKREDVRTPAQNQMQQYLGRRGQSELTPEGRAEADRQHQMSTSVREGGISRSQLADSIRAGAVSRDQAIGMLSRARDPQLVNRFKQLTLEEAERVYAIASPEEQQALAPWLQRKRALDRRANPFQRR